ncbi:protein CCSMST1 [Girardinichthys multiradiatus]|uniref:protein CCSMST1 n=1 Tax=Girardinichthys multiradiatus TaxID=208333 RepID=UPI001FADF08F|nr:protein CCSMST1 [Girardinichthys multiradiatus]
MSPSAGRALSGFTRRILSSGVLIKHASSTVGARSLALTSWVSSRSNPPKEDKVVNSEPIKFSTSKASHRTWKVDRSMGSQHQRPWWKVLPISLTFTAFLLWCAMRKETDVDAKLSKRLPSLVSDEDSEQAEDN